MIGQSLADVYRSAYDSDAYIRRATARMENAEAYNEAPKPSRFNEGIRLGDVPVSCSVISVSVEQQHLLAELDKCLSMLGEKLIPISIPNGKALSDNQKEPSRPAESELYSLLSNNNKYIAQLIYSVNALRDGVQL